MKEKEDDKGNPAVKTLRQETGFTDVLDPLGGPFYVEALTSDIEQRVVSLNKKDSVGVESEIRIGAIGAGNFAGATLLPALTKTDAYLVSIDSASGMSSDHLGKKFGFEQNTTDYKSILKNPDINTLVITTQHNSHARFITEGLIAGKHIFVEKPLALDEEELQNISDVYEKNSHLQLMVGFNRRFSPLTEKIKKLLQNRVNPLAMAMTVNAGIIPADYWVQDKGIGGGRIIGEACHFIDLLMFLAESPILTVSSVQLGRSSDQVCEDKMNIQLSFKDGSIGTINYFSNGNKHYPKEKLEIFTDGKILQLDNFKRLTGYGFKRFKRLRLSSQDKGQVREIACFIQSIKDGKALIPFEQLQNTALASFAAVHSAKENRVIRL